MAGNWNTTQSLVLPAASSPETANDTAKLALEVFKKLLPSNIFFAVLIWLGILGNLLVFLVYLKKFKVSSTRVFVLAMAVLDIFVCLVAVPLHFIFFRFMHTVSDNSFCRVIFLLLKFPVVISCWILVCVSLDRRHRVCQPLKRQLSARQATYVLVVPLGLAILATVPFTVFRRGVKFTTTAGLVLNKCDIYSESELWKIIIKRMEGSVLAVYCFVGLTMLVLAYSNILYKIKSQKKRRRDNFAHDTPPADTVPAPSAPEANIVLADKTETSQDTCEITEEERIQTLDSDSRGERLDVNGSEQEAHSRKTQTREAIENGRQLRGRRQGSRKSIASKTTLVMFVLTTTNVVCLLPYIIWTQFYETYYDPHLSSWTMNLATTSSYLPSVRSTITPFIYICLNPRFRQQCRQFLASVLNICRELSFRNCKTMILCFKSTNF